MNKYILLILLNVLLLNSSGQENYEGYVYDIGTRNAVSDVIIKSSNSEFYTQTDHSGFFSFQINTSQNLENDIEDSYAVLNNAIYWNLSDNVTINMYSLEGNIVFTAPGGNSRKSVLPSLSAAYYILVLQTDQQQIKFLLLSDGVNYQLAWKKNYAITPFYDSSLVFWKQDYYKREVILDENTDLSKVNLLKKSYEDLDYFTELLSYEAFLMIHSSPPTSNYGEIQSIKAVYDFSEDVMYYTNVKKYPSHYSFAEEVLGYENGINNFFWSQYNNSPQRYLHLISINYHKNIDKYVFEFDSWDKVGCDGVLDTYRKLIETSYLKDQLYFYANNLRWQDCDNIPMITSEELFLGQNYQALNLEENYGYLRKVDINELPTVYLGRHDLVLLNGIPNDLSVVSGIITTEFQTSLSHINILSHNRHTPNMALKDGWTNSILDTLLGELVYLKVESDSFLIRKADIEEATAFWLDREPHVPVILDKDIETAGIRELADESYLSVKSIGGKAANFAEMVNLGSIPVPEGYFAIPFYYYHQHLVTNGIDTIIQNLLIDDEFATDLEYRESKLNELKEIIINAPLDADLSMMVNSRLDNFSLFSSYRFRSSTNAEDLEYFSGAGLYDSFSAKKDHPTKTVDMAIKKVWASLWNIRAFNEREYFLIDQNSIAMGILVNRSFPDEDANGVIITHNPYSNNHGYIFNAQFKEFSIVYPEPGIIHDQIIVYTIGLDSIPYTIQYLSHSNIPGYEGETVLSDDEIHEIADYCTILKEYYYENIPHNCNCDYNSFALDIEFKVDSQVEDRKIYFKQARLYLSE